MDDFIRESGLDIAGIIGINILSILMAMSNENC